VQGVAAALTILVVALGASFILRRVGDVLNPPRSTAPSRVPFSGGLSPDTHAWNRYHVRYYPMALLFLAFDMEMVFMYPWAVVFIKEGIIALIEMFMFIAIILLGILYAWREGALRWS
jgi:NADH:ubiquinone oxidoreductase subunit 3 (subunit A)